MGAPGFVFAVEKFVPVQNHGVVKPGARVVGDRDVARATIECEMAVNSLF